MQNQNETAIQKITEEYTKLKVSNFHLYTFFEENPQLYKEYNELPINLLNSKVLSQNFQLLFLPVKKHITQSFTLVLNCPLKNVKNDAKEFLSIHQKMIDYIYEDNPFTKEMFVIADIGTQYSLSFGFNALNQYRIRESIKENNMKIALRLRKGIFGRHITSILAKNFLPDDSVIANTNTIACAFRACNKRIDS